MRTILHQLGLALVTFAGMLAAFVLGAPPAVHRGVGVLAGLALAYVGGHCMAQYDDGMTRKGRR